MKYKLKEHVTDEMLVECGYEVQHFNKLVHAWKKCNNDAIYFVITWGSKHEDDSDKNTKILGWNKITNNDDINKNDIQDLIDLDYVGVVE